MDSAFEPGSAYFLTVSSSWIVWAPSAALAILMASSIWAWLSSTPVNRTSPFNVTTVISVPFKDSVWFCIGRFLEDCSSSKRTLLRLMDFLQGVTPTFCARFAI